MSHTLEVVKKLEHHTFKLLQNYESIKEELNISKSNLVDLKQQQQALEQKIATLTTENEQLKTANAILGSKTYKKETKLKINRLIREVDKCIDQLSE
ncbi:hypothetical protein [Mesohalobacter salilacus]|uniref:hypothetical protein n=1 Tax=Mesohalobacter salilacus TaxID=2491711 RepID=UPI00403EE8C9